MATSWKYRLGKNLGLLLLIIYLIAATLGVVGSAYGLDVLVDFQAWYYWAGAVIAGLLLLYFIPRPIDVMLLAPLAFYGGAKSWGLTWTMSGIIIGLPVFLVILMSLGKKD